MTERQTHGATVTDEHRRDSRAEPVRALVEIDHLVVVIETGYTR